MNYNKAILCGRLTRDPASRATPSGMMICEISIAVNGRGKDKDTFFADCKAFGKTAELVMQYIHKGDELLVEGALKTEKWTGKDGTEKSRLFVYVDRIEFGAHGGQQHAAQPQGQYQQQQPTPQRQQYQQPYAPQAQYGATPAPAQQPPAQADGANGLPF